MERGYCSIIANDIFQFEGEMIVEELLRLHHHVDEQKDGLVSVVRFAPPNTKGSQDNAVERRGFGDRVYIAGAKADALRIEDAVTVRTRHIVLQSKSDSGTYLLPYICQSFVIGL